MKTAPIAAFGLGGALASGMNYYYEHGLSFRSDKERCKKLVKNFALRIADFDIDASVRKE